MDIPPSICRLLWDYDLARAGDGPEWERAVIERVMARGLWQDMRWLLARFSRDRLRGYLAERGRRALPPRELRFWGTVCRVPAQDLDAWVTTAREQERAWRG